MNPNDCTAPGGPLPLVIVDLADRPDCLPILARWHHEQWRALNPADTLEQRETRMRRHLLHGGIPRTFVACRSETALGSASLVTDDMHGQFELTPWLASVFVAPEHRRRGIGARLVLRVVEEARTQGFARIYLYTPDKERFYAGLGWTLLQHTQHQGCPVAVMERTVGT